MDIREKLQNLLSIAIKNQWSDINFDITLSIPPRKNLGTLLLILHLAYANRWR